MNKQIFITQVANGFLVEFEDETYVATSVKDSYGFGSVSLVKVLDEIFNPALPTTED